MKLYLLNFCVFIAMMFLDIRLKGRHKICNSASIREVVKREKTYENKNTIHFLSCNCGVCQPSRASSHHVVLCALQTQMMAWQQPRFDCYPRDQNTTPLHIRRTSFLKPHKIRFDICETPYHSPLPHSLSFMSLRPKSILACQI